MRPVPWDYLGAGFSILVLLPPQTAVHQPLPWSSPLWRGFGHSWHHRALATCSIAIVFLRREQPGKSLFESFVAPMISSICLFGVLIAVLFNMQVFTFEGPISVLLIGMAVAAILAGFASASLLRNRDAVGYQRLRDDAQL